MEFRRFILYFAILLSLILHLGIYLGAQFLPTQVRILPTLPVEIVYTNQKSDQSKQVVADPELGRIEKKARDQARLLSKLTRRVEREMVARNKGPSKNRPPGTTLTTGQPLPNKQKKPQKKSVDPLITSGDLALKTGQKLDLSKPQNPNQRPLGRDLVFGGSTSGEHIPFVEEGSFTSLNTDQFLYYTFFRRVNEQIRYRWV